MGVIYATLSVGKPSPESHYWPEAKSGFKPGFVCPQSQRTSHCRGWWVAPQMRLWRAHGFLCGSSETVSLEGSQGFWSLLSYEPAQIKDVKSFFPKNDTRMATKTHKKALIRITRQGEAAAHLPAGMAGMRKAGRTECQRRYRAAKSSHPTGGSADRYNHFGHCLAAFTKSEQVCFLQS